MRLRSSHVDWDGIITWAGAMGQGCQTVMDVKHVDLRVCDYFCL